jgi:hypothetical protein
MMMSLRGAFAATTAKRACGKQSPIRRGDCFATARNDMLYDALPALHLS